MSTMTAKLLYRRAPRILNLVTHNVFKTNTNQKDPCSQSTPAPEPPPCPPMPQCPPAMCHPVKDPNNPCNYCPSACIDPDAADVTRLKQNQCKFQTCPEIPTYLKGGNIDAFIYQLTVVLATAFNIYLLYVISRKF